MSRFSVEYLETFDKEVLEIFQTFVLGINERINKIVKDAYEEACDAHMYLCESDEETRKKGMDCLEDLIQFLKTLEIMLDEGENVHQARRKLPGFFQDRL